MISKSTMKDIDCVIRNVWLKNIKKDYLHYFTLREDSLKCCFYYHLRRKLATLLKDHHLRIYPEYYFSELGYRADLAIVEIDPNSEAFKLKDMVTQVVAVIEFKFAGGNSEQAASWVKRDIQKMKHYVQSGLMCQLYFAVIYETECESLQWLTKKSTNNWAKGRVTELNAGYINEEMKFEVQSY